MTPTNAGAAPAVENAPRTPAARPEARLVCADWLEAAAALAPSSVDLLYVDPPFNTGRTQQASAGAFEDAWPTTEEHVRWLGDRLAASLGALRPSANVLLHVDWRTSHHVRLLLDELLGADRFVNHLIWRYGLGGSSPRRFARKHDDILFYCVHPDRYWFQAPRIPSTSRRMAGASKKATDVLEIPGVTEDADPAMCDEVLGVPSINNMARERTGWPTQKPLALLELLVGACCPPGGRVLDPCCGSGTTLVAAASLGRDSIGFDRRADAVAMARRRLEAVNAART